MIKKIIFLFVFVTIFGFVNAASLIDTFEDGDSTLNPVWTYSGTAMAVVQSTIVKNGAYSLELNDRSYFTTPVVNENLGNTYKTWVRTSNTNGYAGLIYRAEDFSTNSKWEWNIRQGRINYRGNGVADNPMTTIPSNNTWYLFETIYSKNSSSAIYNLYDESGNLLETRSAGLLNMNDADHITLYAQGNTSYYDDVTYGFDSGPSQPTEIDILKARVNDLNTIVIAQQATIDSLQTQNSQFSQRIGALETETQNLAEQDNQTNQKIGNIETQNNSLQQTVSGLASAVNVLETSVSALQQSFTNFQNLILTYLGALDLTTRQKMVCATLTPQNPTPTGLGLKCSLNQKQVCKCTPI